ncbi:hypothetical protein [Halobacteriovorax sp. RZ-2]|uniref:hypothetical protein n=1 Tax=unclassified Halobacteriovorax TaxID=2639665 RepID=UPI003719C100
MALKHELFTLINERIGAVICLYDQQQESSSQVLEAMNHLVDGTLEERILKSKNKDLIKDGASHFFFSKNYGEQLNIIFSSIPNTPSQNELKQFISVLDAQKKTHIEEKEIVVIKPKGHAFKFHHPSFQVNHFEY